MSGASDPIREHLVRALDWEDAHVGFAKAVHGIPPDKRGARAPGFEHSVWQLVEHIRLAQEDIHDFCVNDAYAHSMTWPDDYWPRDAAPPGEKAWADSIASYRRTLDEITRLVREVPDLAARVPTGDARQTYLRAFLLVADHTAYHVGQIVQLRRALGVWD